MNDIEVAIATALAGAAVVRQRFDTALQRFDKGDGDFATDADVEAERAMLALLRAKRPDDAILESRFKKAGQGSADGPGSSIRSAAR